MTTTVYHLDWEASAGIRELAYERELTAEEKSINNALSYAMTGAVSPAILDLFMGGYYHKVATVETDDLGIAYKLTNNIHQGWWLNDGVTQKFVGEGTRSTSMGDLIRDDAGVWYLVAPAGFTKLIANQESVA